MIDTSSVLCKLDTVRHGQALLCLFVDSKAFSVEKRARQLQWNLGLILLLPMILETESQIAHNFPVEPV